MDNLQLFLYECSSLDLSQTLAPYLGDLIRRRGRFTSGGLGLLTNHDPSAFSLYAGDANKGDDSVNVVWFADVSTNMSAIMEDGEAERLCFDLITHIPLERVIYLETTLPILRSEELSVKMHNLTCLNLPGVNLSTWFIEPDVRGSHSFKELLRGLEHVIITRPALSGGWNPFTSFLSRRAAVGNPTSSLRLGAHPHMDESVVESIKRAVKVFEDEDKNSDEEVSDEEDGGEEDGNEEDSSEEGGNGDGDH